MLKYSVQTFGCQMNYSDSERMEGYLQALGFEKAEVVEGADLILFNSCSIRQKAEDRVYGALKNLNGLKEKNPDLIVVVTGCMARLSSSKYSVKRDRLFGKALNLDIVLKTEELPRLAELMREVNEDLEVEAIEEEGLTDYLKISPTHDSHESKAQAFVAISNGCDKFCTYCIVPYSRGREKSRGMEDIYKEVKNLVENGCKEVTIIGQTVNSYGLSTFDKEDKTFEYLGNKEPFVELLERLDTLKTLGLRRVRFTSPHPKDMSEQLIEAMARLETQMPYLHLPVQSGDNRTLKRMNRTYTVESYKEIVKKLREAIPGIAISTDVIVGFCKESDEEFENTWNFFKEMGFEMGFLAQYSQRTGTTAAKFMKDDIDKKVKKERWHKLNDLLKENAKKGLKRFIGKEVEVLVESQDGELCSGRSEHFKTVQFKSGRKLLGEIVRVKVEEALQWNLVGALV